MRKKGVGPVKTQSRRAKTRQDAPQTGGQFPECDRTSLSWPSPKIMGRTRACCMGGLQAVGLPSNFGRPTILGTAQLVGLPIGLVGLPIAISLVDLPNSLATRCNCFFCERLFFREHRAELYPVRSARHVAVQRLQSARCSLVVCSRSLFHATKLSRLGDEEGMWHGDGDGVKVHTRNTSTWGVEVSAQPAWGAQGAQGAQTRVHATSERGGGKVRIPMFETVLESETKRCQAGTKSVESPLLGAFCMAKNAVAWAVLNPWTHGGDGLHGADGLYGVELGCMGFTGLHGLHGAT
eukprot:365068-Chlamydomonas_euryale.AAC.3